MDSQTFRTPPKEYREVPFWSWNDDLDPQELRRQIAIMDEAGWGGFFMHARVGLRTPYMGKRWMECIDASIDEARQRGMLAWMYDEDKWPSGFAGGLSVCQDPEFRLQALVCKLDNRAALLPERIATFAAREEQGALVDIRAEHKPVIASDSDRIIQFYRLIMPLGLPWFNDYAYLSLINPRAVRAFIETTHEVYAARSGADFGKTVPGIFTDEPAFMFRGHGGQIPTLSVPWTKDFPAYFQKRRGYDLLAKLPALFYQMDGAEAVRYDYWRTVTERFVESYAKQIYQWCAKHNLKATGHMMAEDTLLSQIWWIGAAMPHYPYFHQPGIDKLGRIINEGPGTILTVKQLDSAVCQLGKERALCENYGCSGHDFAHTGRKWIGDWAYVLGITLNNPHLSLYSMRGERKRDYPQVVFYQQPWWKDNRLIADYFGRLSYVLSQGRRVVDVLVVHPMGSAWAVFTPGANRPVDQLDRPLNGLLMSLMEQQRDFHLGDEMLMNKGGAAQARVTTGPQGTRLVVGKMSYRVVVVPPGVTLAENTVRLLREFAAAGGAVLAIAPTPTLIDGRPAKESPLPPSARLVTIENTASVLDDILPFDVRVPNRPQVWAHHRRVDDSDVYFLANIDQHNGGVATVQIAGTGHIEEWDLVSGETRPLPSRQHDGITEVTLDFPPVGSHLLVRQARRRAQAVLAAPEHVVAEVPLADAWRITKQDANALTLDTVQVKIGDGDWSGPLHILDAHGQVAAAGAGTRFALRYTALADATPPAPVYLVVESPERFAITVNGKAVKNADEGWWIDSAFRRLNLGRLIQAGHNEIVMEGVYGLDTELESVYLVGDFGVSARRLKEENRLNGQVFDRYTSDFRLTPAPCDLRSGLVTEGLRFDLTRQGFAFFAGCITLGQTLALASTPARAVLNIAGLRAAVAHVRVNGVEMGAVAWQPHCVDITAGLRPGDNLIEIELVGTLRNLLGPHHTNGGDLKWVGPGEFRDKSRWTGDYIQVPFGLDHASVTFYAAQP